MRTLVINVLEMDLCSIQKDVDIVEEDVMMKGHHKEVILFLKFTF